MFINFNCPECQERLHAPVSYAGKRVKCARCGSAIAVPTSQNDGEGVTTTQQPGSRAERSVNPPSPDRNGGITVACPSCKSQFQVILQGDEPIGSLHVVCDHCGVEKKLKACQREYQKQKKQEAKEREAAEERRRQAEEDAKKAFENHADNTSSEASDTGSHLVGGELVFEGKYTPNVSLLDGEKVLDVIEGGFWDLGLIGWLFGYRLRMVLTTHRVFYFQKKIIDNLVEILWLRRVKSVVVGQGIKAIQFVIGLLFVLHALSPFSFAFDNNSSWPGYLLFLFELIFGTALMYMARMKVIKISTGEDKAAIKLIRLQTEESRRFLDSLFNIVDGYERQNSQDM